MFCPNCGIYNEDNASFCSGCGSRLASNTKTTKADVLTQLSALSICFICVLYALYTALFAPLWTLPAFGGGDELREIAEEISDEIYDIKREFRQEEDYYSRKEQRLIKEFIDISEKFAGKTNLVNSMKYCKFFTGEAFDDDYISVSTMKDYERASSNLTKQLVYIIVMFVLSVAYLVVAAVREAGSKKQALAPLLLPALFCFLYSGVLTLIVFLVPAGFFVARHYIKKRSIA